MKVAFLFLALLIGIAFSTTSATTAEVDKSQKERGTMKFHEPVRVLGVVLKGEYLFVHDDAALARGETCTFVYKGTAELPSNLVISFHCTPAERHKAKSFVVRSKHSADGVIELQEIQFAGSTKAHMVAAHQDRTDLECPRNPSSSINLSY